MKKATQFTFISAAIALAIYGVFVWPVYGLILFLSLLFITGLHDLIQKKHAILRNYPVVGHFRYLLEMIGPEIKQYFVESDTDGKPIDRNHRAYVYQRAKKVNDTHPFGSDLDMNAKGYSWGQHSIYPSIKHEIPPRITIGGKDCLKPYSASIFNISAMSYGSLSKNAIQALNLGAKAGGFYHNTGEGGLTEYHLKGADVVYQLGTGYFGSRAADGTFSPEKFKVTAGNKEVKMIEIKISQGAKPGHGGVLPASKNNREIANIRGVEPHTAVLSPPGHSAFSDASGLLRFIQELRDLSEGKPIGFKLCIGNRKEFDDICLAMKTTGILPDFITVDGSEGGTGAAPIDFSNNVGMPWEEGLIFVVDTLVKHGLKKDIKIITATKIITAYDIFKALCIGADVCNSARGMMLSLGCIQSLKCNKNNCPTGVATNNLYLMKGLVVSEKWKRVRNYHEETVADFLSILSATGCTNVSQLNRSLIYKRHNNNNDWVTYS